MQSLSNLYLVLFFFVSFSINLFAQKADAQLNKLLNEYRQAYNLPGIAASVITPSGIQYGLSGVKNIGSNKQLTFDSKFHLASNTKAITAMLAAILVAEGKIEWEEKLLDVVPELKEHSRADYLDITLAQLLSHQAMILPFESDNSSEWKKMPKDLNKQPDPKLAFAIYALGLKPKKNKDSNHLYSNGGYTLAALMMERKSGQSWEQLLDDLCSKLDLAYYVGFPSQENTGGTNGHQEKGSNRFQALAPQQEYPFPAYLAPAGHLSMNLVDFSELIRMHLEGLMGTNNVLSAELYQQMHFGIPYYSLGWYNGNIGDTEEKFSYHGGSLGSFSSSVMLSADRSVAIIILVNSDGKVSTEAKNELRKELWEMYGKKN